MRVSLALGMAFTLLICLIVVNSMMRSADTSYAQSQAAKVEAAFLDEWDRFHQLKNPDDEAIEKLFWMECETNRFDVARDLMRGVQRAHEKNATAGYDEVYAASFGKLASADIYQHRFADALKQYQQQLAYDRKHLRGDDKHIGRDYSNMGQVYFMIGHTTDDTTKRAKIWRSAQECFKVAEETQITTDPLYDLSLQQNKLALAQGIGDVSAIEKLEQSARQLRKKLDLKAPTFQL